MASWTVKGCTPQTLFAASTWMLLLLAGMSCAQPEQPEPYYVSCYNSVGVNFSNIVSDDAPLGSYDYRTAVFLPEQSPNVTTGVRCAAQCRSIGRQLSGLILTDENQYRCTCGIAWTGFPILPELTNGSNCSACASDPNSLCPSTVESVAIYYHRPSYTPASVVYGNCFAFSEELQQSLQQSGDGVLASSWAGALLEAQQPSTCITECLLKGFPLGGVGDSASCWCFRDFPSGLSTFVCQSAGCLGSVALDGNRPAGVVDDLICGGFDQISLYGGIAHRVPNITTVPAAGTQLYRTEGDAGDMFTCNAQIDSIYLPLEVQWVNGSGSQDGNALSTAQLAVFNVSNDWTTTSRGGYSAGDFTFRCLATPTPDNSIPPQLARSDIAVTVFRIPTPAIVESGLPILATDLPGSTYSLDCINAVRGTPVGISWTGPTGTLESSNSTLHFPNPTRENEGSYTCSFTVEETNRPATGSFSVTLYETPVVDLPTARVHATGDLVRCSEFVSNIGNAAALLNYTWTLPSGVEVMADAIATHVPGTYTCVVVNTLLDTAGAGAAARGQDNLMVTVLPPVIVNTSVVGVEGSVVHRDSRTNDRYVVVPGASSSFNCTEFGGGNVTYRWLKVNSNGQTTVQTTQPYFTLTNVGADQDGQYQCEVTNPRIESASGTITALVIYDVFFTPQVTFPAEVVYAIIDEAYTLQCSVTGDQPDNFTWTMGGSEDVLGTEQNLTFTSVERINSGTYECSVSGQPVDTLPAYSHTATVELTAQAAASASLSREDSVIVEAGGEVEIQCTASGETPADASITWERDGQALQDQEERITLTRAGAVLTLSFSSILTADAGQYTCRVVDSTVGLQGRQTAMSTVQLSVTGADPQTDDTDNVPIIIGVVCGIVGLLLIVVLVVIIVKQWKKKKAGNGGTDNPTYGESTAVVSTHVNEASA
eukprot:scpid43287/ scgid7628/ Hemicentin-1; Fibulin-6